MSKVIFAEFNGVNIVVYEMTEGPLEGKYKAIIEGLPIQPLEQESIGEAIEHAIQKITIQTRTN